MRVKGAPKKRVPNMAMHLSVCHIFISSVSPCAKICCKTEPRIIRVTGQPYRFKSEQAGGQNWQLGKPIKQSLPKMIKTNSITFKRLWPWPIRDSILILANLKFIFSPPFHNRENLRSRVMSIIWFMTCAYCRCK